MVEDEERTRRAAYVGILIAVTAVSFSAILIMWSTADFLAIAAGRMLLSTLLLAPFAFLLFRKEMFSLPRRDVLIMVGIGAVLATHFSLWIASLGLTSVAASVVLVTSHPILVGLVGHFFMGERLSGLNALGIMVGFSGVIILTSGHWEGGTDPLVGDLLAFAGGIAAGVYILGGRRTRQRISLVVYAFIVYGSCTLFLLVAVVMTGAPLFALHIQQWGLFLVMALGPSILGHTMYNWTLRYVPASVVSVSLLGEPIGSTLLAFLLLSQTPSNIVVVGFVVILAGILMATWGMGTNRAKAEVAAVT